MTMGMEIPLHIMNIHPILVHQSLHPILVHQSLQLASRPLICTTQALKINHS